jgi:S-adenosylmethionine decarboxylase
MQTINQQTITAAATTHEARGVHLLLTLFGCNVEMLNCPAKLTELTMRAATATGATIMQSGVQQFAPQGVTAFVVLAESHASLHTYPESRTVFWDCFTCGDTCDPEKSVKVLIDALGASHVQKQIVSRG